MNDENIPQTTLKVMSMPDNDFNNKNVQSVIDSSAMKWLSKAVSVIIVPIFLWGGYHLLEEIESHSKAITEISGKLDTLTNKIDNVQSSQNELKNAVVVMAQAQGKDEINIASIQQEDLDKRSAPAPAASPPVAPAPLEERPHEHHASRAKPPQIDLLAAIQKIFSPPHGVRARATANWRSK